MRCRADEQTAGKRQAPRDLREIGAALDDANRMPDASSAAGEPISSGL
jgi:hypothetical protein